MPNLAGLRSHTKRDLFTGQKIFVEINLKGKEAQKRIMTGQRLRKGGFAKR